MDVYTEAEQLRQVPMFSRLEGSRLKLLAFTSESIVFRAGEDLFHEHDISDAAYVIMEGTVEVLADSGDGKLVPVVTRGKNELIGEMAVLTNSPRSATLRARSDVRALRIDNETFVRLVSENPDIALDVMSQLSDKLAKSHQQVEELQRRLERTDS